MKKSINYPNRTVLVIVLVIFTLNFSYSQMTATEVEENSVLKSFKDKNLVWGDCPPFMPEG